jgi:ATP-dependent exoDNAse (exonuclease V) alpha subunit
LATYRFHISSVGRGAGRRATAAAAYRAGERLRDERSGRLYNYSRRKDVVHTEIFLPSHLAGAADAWAGNRERLWNTAERAEKQSNSRVAREYQVSLPHELSTAQQVALVRALSRELAERYKVAVDLSVHLPRPEGDPRNYHAHLLTTTREVTPQGLGAKTGLDMQTRERRRRELPGSRAEFHTLRERWATLANAALREANVEARVDHRSLAARGIDREPLPHNPTASLKMAERIREEYRRRVAARLERVPTMERPNQAAPSQAAPTQAAPTQEASARPNGTEAPAGLKDIEEIRRQAREAWRQLRTHEADGHGPRQPSGRELGSEGREHEAAVGTPGHDDDLAL